VTIAQEGGWRLALVLGKCLFICVWIRKGLDRDGGDTKESTCEDHLTLFWIRSSGYDGCLVVFVLDAWTR